MSKINKPDSQFVKNQIEKLTSLETSLKKVVDSSWADEEMVRFAAGEIIDSQVENALRHTEIEQINAQKRAFVLLNSEQLALIPCGMLVKGVLVFLLLKELGRKVWKKLFKFHPIWSRLCVPRPEYVFPLITRTSHQHSLLGLFMSVKTKQMRLDTPISFTQKPI